MVGSREERHKLEARTLEREMRRIHSELQATLQRNDRLETEMDFTRRINAEY